MSDQTVPVRAPLRDRLISWYGEIADTERGLGRAEREAYARAQIDRLERFGVLDLSVLLEVS